jgi:ankyrin repeat protein
VAGARQRSAAEIDRSLYVATTVLYLAAHNGHAECVDLLLNAGADKEATDNLAFTPLLIAVQRGHATCVTLLLNAGADRDARTDNGSTALFVAAAQGHLQSVKLLLKAGCDVNALNSLGCSALFVSLNHVDCARALVQAEADITIEVGGLSLDEFLIKCTTNSDELRAALLVPVKKRRRCDQCGMTGQKMMKCGACKTTYYCNRECQTANWPLHKQVCSLASD